MKLTFFIVIILFSIEKVFPQTILDTVLKEKKYYDLSETINVNPDSVKILWLRGKNYKEIPIEIRKFKQLIMLDISMNEIFLIPDWISEMNKLKILTINYNPITKLPDNIGDLSELRQLNLNNTNIDYLPNSIKRLEMLQQLSLGFTPILTFPPKLYKLPNLKVLDLDTKVDSEDSRFSTKEQNKIKRKLKNTKVIF